MFTATLSETGRVWGLSFRVAQERDFERLQSASEAKLAA
jgi:hypothetical protein